MSQGTAKKVVGQQLTEISSPVVVASDQPPTRAEQQIIDLLTNVLVELQVITQFLQSGLNVQDDPQAIRDSL